MRGRTQEKRKTRGTTGGLAVSKKKLEMVKLDQILNSLIFFRET